MEKLNILITTFPFGKSGTKPLDILKTTGHNIVNNPLGRRVKPSEIAKLIKDFDIVIAGTEPFTIESIKNSKIKAFFRVGIGLDNIPLNYCNKNNITVGYTPEAPAQAVAELTLANIINLSRDITKSDRSVRNGSWNRYIGYLLEERTIGLVGLGRIGSKVAHLLQPFNTKIIANDIANKTDLAEKYNIEIVDKKTLFQTSDIISLHIPSNKDNFHYINKDTLAWIKNGSAIINTSRGSIVDENALYDALIQNHLSGAAIDVFNKEPYHGKLKELDNTILTAHMGASAKKSRYLMELGAAEDCINYLNKLPLNNNAIIEEHLSQSIL